MQNGYCCVTPVKLLEIHSPGLARNPSYRVLEIVLPEPFCSEYLRRSAWGSRCLLGVGFCVLQELDLEEAAAIAGTWCWSNCVSQRSCMKEAVCATGARRCTDCARHRNLARRLPMLLQPRAAGNSSCGVPPVPSTLKAKPVLTDKGTIFKGPTSIFTKQAMKSDFGFEMQ